MVGAATAKLREPKHVRTRGTDNKLHDERSLRDGTAIKGSLSECVSSSVEFYVPLNT